MTSERAGFALRPGIFSATEIAEASKILDNSRKVTSIFIPDGRAGPEALDVSSSILGITRQVNAGSGVIRLLEHDQSLLVRRVQAIQAFSNNRLILGVGTGSPGPDPGGIIAAMLQKVDGLKREFQSYPSGIEAPRIYVAALKLGIARKAIGKADGLLLNFCTPGHANRIVDGVRHQAVSAPDFACYMKIFFSSKDDETAKILMIQEFLNYDKSPQYHEMFLQDGTADAVSKFRIRDDWRFDALDVPRELFSVSLANPSDHEFREYVQSFRTVGIELPVAYPYFAADEGTDFKLETVKRIIKLM